MLASLARLHPLIQPLAADQLPATQSEVVQPWQALDTATQHVANVRLRASKDLGDLADGQNLGFAHCFLHDRPHLFSAIKKGSANSRDQAIKEARCAAGMLVSRTQYWFAMPTISVGCSVADSRTGKTSNCS